jgi:hypothetical protein
MEAKMNTTRLALIAATAALLTGAAYAQTQGAVPAKESGATSGMRKDDPCAEPKTPLKKKSTQRQADDKAKSDTKKP